MPFVAAWTLAYPSLRAYATASRKYGEIVGSPPENCTDICRRGLMLIALSSTILMSSHDSSWTNPTWLASMKHGSHIMLQRFVRSTVRTDPRPCLIVLLPWLCSVSSLCARMSRPGNTSSRCLKNAVSIAITSSKWPWTGQSFTIMILPSRSRMVALISPTLSFSNTLTSFLPSRISCRASRTQTGQSESVWRGQPSGGFDFSYDLRSGLSDHFGVKAGRWPIWFRPLKTTQAPLAAIDRPFSTYLTGACMHISSRHPPSEGSKIWVKDRREKSCECEFSANGPRMAPSGRWWDLEGQGGGLPSRC